VTAPTLKRPTDVEVPMSSFSEDAASYISECGATISAGCPADGYRGSRASHRNRESWTGSLSESSLPTSEHLPCPAPNVQVSMD
jgi:hypothetical protein